VQDPASSQHAPADASAGPGGSASGPTPPSGGVFVARSQVMDGADLARATRRMAHEVIERNHGVSSVVVVGLYRGGARFGEQLAAALSEIEGVSVPVGVLDVSFYRDDIALRRVVPQAVTEVPVDLTGKVVVLADDVLFTGRTVRAALDALNDHGRPRAVQLAVLIDRGHRELPIRPDYVGKNLPTRRDERVEVGPDGVVIGERVPIAGEGRP